MVREHLAHENVTLLYATKEERFNQAVVMEGWLKEKLRKKQRSIPLKCALMQDESVIGYALANFAPAEGKNPEKLKVYAQMQYRHEIGHALANLAFAAVLTNFKLRFARFQ